MSPSRPVHFALRALYAFTMLRQRTHRQPTDVPAVRTGDPKADRILVVGNGPSHGWGVLTHQLAVVAGLDAGLANERSPRQALELRQLQLALRDLAHLSERVRGG